MGDMTDVMWDEMTDQLIWSDEDEDVEEELKNNTNMIYTLDYLEREAKDILGNWNGEDEKFVDANGDVRTEYDVDLANELVETLTKARELAEALDI